MHSIKICRAFLLQPHARVGRDDSQWNAVKDIAYRYKMTCIEQTDEPFKGVSVICGRMRHMGCQSPRSVYGEDLWRARRLEQQIRQMLWSYSGAIRSA